MATENNETTVPLYNRGSERINLDAVANAVNIDIMDKLERSGLKDELKKLVRSEISKLILGMYDGNVTYRMSGGFDNTIGMTNKEKGFDASAIAAGIVGNAVRRASVYLDPKAKIDSSKQTWNSTKAIQEALLNNIYGTSKGDIPDSMFIDLDLPVNGVRSHEKRVGKLKLALNDILGDFEGTFNKYNYSPDDETKSRTAIKKVVDEILNDDKVTDNELLDLYKLTGIDFRNSFYTGEGYPTKTSEQLSSEETITPTPLATTPLLEESIPSIFDWRNLNYPSLAVNPSSILLNSTTVIGTRELRNWLKGLIDQLDNSTLFNILLEGINNPKSELFRNFKTEKGTHLKFSNLDIMEAILLKLLKIGALNSFRHDDGTYYINNSYDSSKGIGVVWNPTTRQLTKKSAYDIPYFVSYISNEYYKKYPLAKSYKEGGVIRKFDSGGTSPILTFNPKRNNIYYTGDWSGYNNWHANNIVLPWLNNYLNADLIEWEDIIKKGLDSWKNAGGFDWYNATDEQRKHGMQSQGTKQHLQYVIDNLPGLNVEIAKHVSDYSIPANANTDDRLINGVPKGTDTDFGILTGNRRPTIHINTTGLDLTDWENFYKNLGYVGKYLYLDHWVPTKDTNVLDIILFNSPLKTNLEPQVEIPITEKQQSSQNTDLSGYVGEGGLPEGKDRSFGTQWWLELTPELIGAGRLWASLATNRNVFNTLMPSLRPVLRSTYERYSPITGAFSAMLLKNRQGADVMRLASQPFTSDASLAAARMLEGQKQASQLQTEGFLMDDQEIKRTLAEALARQEDNMARRSDVANFNRASINQTNRERAQLKASHIKSNWSSIDNFLAETLANIRRRFDEIKERSDSFMDNLDYSAAEEWYNDVMKQPLSELAEYTKDGTKTMESWDKLSNYQDYKALAQKYKEAMLRERIARRYGMSYKNPYSQDSYKTFTSVWR